MRGRPLPEFGGSGAYRIVVRGWPEAADDECIGGMQITRSRSDDGLPIATLVGNTRDQAQLQGILTTLYEWHLTVLLVEALPPGEPG